MKISEPTASHLNKITGDSLYYSSMQGYEQGDEKKLTPCVCCKIVTKETCSYSLFNPLLNQIKLTYDCTPKLASFLLIQFLLVFPCKVFPFFHQTQHC